MSLQRGRAARGRRGPVSLSKERPAGRAGADVQQVQAGVAAALAAVVGSAVPEDQPLMEAGLDSLGTSCFHRSSTAAA